MFRIDAPHLAWVLENLVAGTVVNQIVVDPDTRPGSLVFNRTVSLRDTWAKIQQKTEA